MTCPKCEQLKEETKNPLAKCKECGVPYYLARIEANAAAISWLEKEIDRCRKVIQFYGIGEKK
jgi:uncharacterized Zn finger protein